MLKTRLIFLALILPGFVLLCTAPNYRWLFVPYLLAGVILGRIIWGWRSRLLLVDVVMVFLWPIFMACGLLLSYIMEECRQQSMLEIMRGQITQV